MHLHYSATTDKWVVRGYYCVWAVHGVRHECPRLVGARPRMNYDGWFTIRVLP